MKIFIAGHNGLVGSAIYNLLKKEDVIVANKSDLNLERQNEVEKYFKENKPDIVICAAAKVGGIHSNNKYRAEFIYNNLQIQNNLIHTSYISGVKKLLFLGSSCIYPKNCEQPMKENYLLKSELEYTNEPYAIAKIAGIKMCESYYKQYGCNFISVMPTNLYGENDNFNLDNSHVIPALIRKFHIAKIENSEFVEIWGTGNARREFMYIKDMAEACVHVLKNINASDIFPKNISHINIGTGKDIQISDLAELIKDITECKSKIKYLSNKPDGTILKKLDVSLLSSLGYNYKTELREGLEKTYKWFLENEKNIRL